MLTICLLSSERGFWFWCNQFFRLAIGFVLMSDTLAGIHHIRPGDDAAAIQAIFERAQSGDEIRFQPGTYRIKPAYPAGHMNAPLRLIGKTGITLLGAEDGVELFSDGPGELLLFSGCSNMRIENITFRSTGAPVENGDWLYSMIMLYSRNEKLTFEDCRFLSFGNHALSQLYGVKQSTEVTVRNCFFADGGDRVAGDGAAVSGIGSNWLIESNRVERCLYGFEIEGLWGTNRNIIVRKNTIINPRGCGIVLFATSGRSSDFSNIEISDNLIKDAVRDSGNAIYPAGILVGGGERVRILRNTIDQAGSGISVQAQWADVRDSVIAGNRITNAVFTGIHVYEYLNYKATNILVRSNIISATGQAGIKVAGMNIRVQGNSVENSGWQGLYGGVEVEKMHATEGVRIDGNVICNSKTAFQDYGIWLRPDVRNSVIGPNQFRENARGAIFDQAINTVIETRILGATFPTWELGSRVKIFAAPRLRGQIQTSGNLTHWTSAYDFVADANGEASVLVTPEMILIGNRYYRAVHPGKTAE